MLTGERLDRAIAALDESSRKAVEGDTEAASQMMSISMALALISIAESMEVLLHQMEMRVGIPYEK